MQTTKKTIQRSFSHAEENTPLIMESQTGNTMLITGGPVVVANFGPEPQILECPYCKTFTSTKLSPTATTKTHLFALVLCMCCCWLCSCCPYIIDACQNQNHYCSSCNALLGVYLN